MCAGLYPNIARIRLSADKSSKRPCLLETKFEKQILIHPRSINAKLRVDLLISCFIKNRIRYKFVLSNISASLKLLKRYKLSFTFLVFYYQIILFD
jgi:hypothetical protein